MKSPNFTTQEWRSIRGSLLKDAKMHKEKGHFETAFMKKAIADRVFDKLTGRYTEKPTS